MSGLQCEEVMTWTVDDVVNWIQKNNMGIFRAFISRECINGQKLLQLDKKKLETATECNRSEKEALLKLLKNIGKEKDKKKSKMPSIWKAGKGAMGSAAVPTSVRPPSFKPPQPPVEDEEFEEISDPDEWDDDRGIYDNDTQPLEFETNHKGHRLSEANEDSENESEYVNPDEEFPHENNESYSVQESYYEEDTTSIQRASGGRGAAPPPPIHDEEELYEDPDHNVTLPPPPLPPLPSAPSKSQRPPPPIPSDDFYEHADPPMKAPPVKRSNYESAAIARMPSASKTRGIVPPAPTLVQQEQLPEKVPDRPPPRRPVPPPCQPVPEDDHDDPAPPVRPLPPLAKRTVPVPCPPAPLLPSLSQEIYEEAEDLEEKALPPSRRGSQGCVRPPLPVPPSEDDDMYEPTADGALELRDDDDDDDVPVRSKLASTQPTVPGLNTINYGVNSIALRDTKGNLKKTIPKFIPENSSTNNATTEVKGKCQESTQRVQPRPCDVPKKQPPAPPSKTRSGGAPGGPDSAEPPREKAPPGAPPVQKTVADPNDVTTQPWFFGDFASNEASVLLKKLNTDGTYLVRESKRSGHLYTLALIFREDIFNIPIRKRDDGKFALGSQKADEHVFETVNDMVRFHRNNAIEVSKEGKAVGKVKLAKIAQK